MKKHKLLHFDKPATRRRGRFETSTFDPEMYTAVIRSSICTGEKTAGFKNNKDGHFTEVMLIRSDKDLQEFKEQYNVDTVKTEY